MKVNDFKLNAVILARSLVNAYYWYGFPFAMYYTWHVKNVSNKMLFGSRYKTVTSSTFVFVYGEVLTQI